MSARPESVPSLLALKRFVRRVVKQVSFSVVSLLLVLTVATHSSATQDVSQTALQPQLTQTRALISHPQTTSHSLRPLTGNRPIRLLHSSVLHHHLTGSRLSTAAILSKRGPEIAQTPAIKSANTQ